MRIARQQGNHTEQHHGPSSNQDSTQSSTDRMKKILPWLITQGSSEPDHGKLKWRKAPHEVLGQHTGSAEKWSKDWGFQRRTEEWTHRSRRQQNLKSEYTSQKSNQEWTFRTAAEAENQGLSFGCELKGNDDRELERKSKPWRGLLLPQKNQGGKEFLTGDGKARFRRHAPARQIETDG
jgi:hypothetical protein